MRCSITTRRDLITRAAEHGLLTNLLVGVVGALIGGFLFSTILGFTYAEGLNLGSILVATVGAIILLWILGWTGSRRRLQ